MTSCPLVDEREVVVCERLVVPCTPLCVPEVVLELHGCPIGLAVEEVPEAPRLGINLIAGWVLPIAGVPRFGATIIGVAGADGADTAALGSGAAHGAGGAVDLNLIAGCVLVIAGVPGFGGTCIGIEAKGVGADTVALGSGAAHGAGGAVDLNLIAGWILVIAGVLAAAPTSGSIGVEAEGAGADIAALGDGAAGVAALAVEAFGAHGAGGPAVEEVPEIGAVDLNLIAGCATSGIGVEANGTGADTTALGGGAAGVVVLAVEAFGVAHGAGGPAVEEAGWVLPIAGMPAFGAATAVSGCS